MAHGDSSAAAVCFVRLDSISTRFVLDVYCQPENAYHEFRLLSRMTPTQWGGWTVLRGLCVASYFISRSLGVTFASNVDKGVEAIASWNHSRKARRFPRSNAARGPSHQTRYIRFRESALWRSAEALLSQPPWRQPMGKSQVNLPQMPPPGGGI